MFIHNETKCARAVVCRQHFLCRHPDKNVGQEAEAEAQFKQLTAAYQYLISGPGHDFDDPSSLTDDQLCDLILTEEFYREAVRLGLRSFDLLYL